MLQQGAAESLEALSAAIDQDQQQPAHKELTEEELALLSPVGMFVTSCIAIDFFNFTSLLCEAQGWKGHEILRLNQLFVPYLKKILVLVSRTN